MTWSYDPSSGTVKDRVRFLVGDTFINDPQLQDEEITWAIASRTTPYGAAAECCRALAAKFSRSVSFKSGQSSVSLSDLAKAYALRAVGLDQQAALTGSGMPYAGGISVTDKRQQESDTDRVPPQFNIGMDDNYILPFGPAANENEDDAQPDQE